MKTKTKRVCVTPLTQKAKNRFTDEMDLFHTCTVEEEQIYKGTKHYYLKSLKGNYYFWVPVKGNQDWKVE